MNKQSDEKKHYLQNMEKERGYLLEFHKILAEEDFDFLKGYNAFLQAAYLNSDAIPDSKTKELILIAILVSVRSTTNHIKTHIELAKSMGATKNEVLAVLEMCLPPAGLPAFMEGFAIWREVFEL